MQNNRFTATLDTKAKIITNVFLFGGLLLLAYTTFENSGDGDLKYGLVYLLIPVTIIAWGFHPQYYEIRPKNIRIKRPFGSIIIPIDEITGITAVDFSQAGINFRLFASGGLFGYFGLYSSNRMGRYSMWS